MVISVLRTGCFGYRPTIAVMSYLCATPPLVKMRMVFYRSWRRHIADSKWGTQKYLDIDLLLNNQKGMGYCTPRNDLVLADEHRREMTLKMLDTSKQLDSIRVWCRPCPSIERSIDIVTRITLSIVV